MSEILNPQGSFSDLSVIITGATRGIGAGIAEKLSLLAASLTLGYIEGDDTASALLDKLKKNNPNVIVHKDDLSTREGARGITGAAIENFGRVDVLVGNLGPFLYRDIFETSADEWDSMIATNLSAHFYLVKELLPGMRERSKGNFIFIGGTGSGQVTGHPKSAAYNAAKVGLAEFMKSLAVEEASNGIRSNMIAPGVIDNGEYSNGFRDRIVNDIPMGKIGEPADIANAVAWLISEESRYVTGTVIDVSGGYHLVRG